MSSLVHIAPKTDHFNKDGFRCLINRIDNANVANPHPQAALQLTGQRLDAVMM
jgi:hypothetical protein